MSDEETKPIVMASEGGQEGGPTKEEYNEVLAVTAGLAHALESADVPLQVATGAAMLLAAELAAQSEHHNREIIEAFRKTFVAARKRWREAQN